MIKKILPPIINRAHILFTKSEKILSFQHSSFLHTRALFLQFHLLLLHEFLLLFHYFLIVSFYQIETINGRFVFHHHEVNNQYYFLYIKQHFDNIFLLLLLRYLFLINDTLYNLKIQIIFTGCRN